MTGRSAATCGGIGRIVSRPESVGGRSGAGIAIGAAGWREHEGPVQGRGTSVGGGVAANWFGNCPKPSTWEPDSMEKKTARAWSPQPARATAPPDSDPPRVKANQTIKKG